MKQLINHFVAWTLFCYRVAGLVAYASLICSRVDAQSIRYQSSHGYLDVQVLEADIIQFEVSAKNPAPASGRPIERSPMVNPSYHPTTPEFQRTPQGIQTSLLQIRIDQSTLCVLATQRSADQRLNEVCPLRLSEPWKGLTINAPDYRRLFGLGQSFQPSSSPLSWYGKEFYPGPFGNELRGFAGGATAHTQFPVLYALAEDGRQFAIFFDSVYKQKWNFRNSPYLVESWGDELRWFLISGTDLADLRKKYLKLSGPARSPSIDMFGFWLSQFGNNSWQKLRGIADEFEMNDAPIDGFGIDLQWYGGRFNQPDQSRMGTMSWDAEHFADAPKHISFFRSKNIGIMPIEQPYVAINLREHDELARRDFLARDCERCGPTFIDHNSWWGRGGMIDYSSAVAAKFWHQWKRAPLIAMGIAAHWCDLGEPELYKDWSYYHGLTSGKHQHGDVHNLFNLAWAASIDAGYEEQFHNRRSSSLHRSGTSGIQRYGVAMWSGDIAANLESMKAHYAAQSHLSLVGIDQYGSDIGGFYRHSSDGQESALYSIWLANASLIDVPMRSHVWNLDGKHENNPLKIGDLTSNLFHLRLRYRLLPYLYSIAHQPNKVWPQASPLFFYFPNDPNTYQTKMQKMIGPYLMTHLIDTYEPMLMTYMPIGRWFDFYSAAPIPRQQPRIQRILDQGTYRLPLYLREGAIVPMLLNEEPRNSHDYSSDLRLLVATSTEPSDFTMVDKQGFAAKHISQQRLQHLQSVISINNLSESSEASGIAEIRIYDEHMLSGAKLNEDELIACSDEIRSECWVNQQHGSLIYVPLKHKLSKKLELRLQHRL